MAGFKEFVEQLTAAGVVIEGEETLTKRVAGANGWATVVATLAVEGREQGVRFTRISMDQPSNAEIHAIARRYHFTPAEQDRFAENVVCA